jgi:hypothetical protein
MEGGHQDEGEPYVDFGSGVVELERRDMTADELAEGELPPEIAAAVNEKIGPRLQAAVNQALIDGTTEVPLDISMVLARPNHDTVALRLNRAVAEGLILTHADRESVRTAIMQDVAAETAVHVAPVIAFLDDHGIVPDFIGTHSTVINAHVPPEVVLELEARDDVIRMDLQGGPVGFGGAVVQLWNDGRRVPMRIGGWVRRNAQFVERLLHQRRRQAMLSARSIAARVCSTVLAFLAFSCSEKATAAGDTSTCDGRFRNIQLGL